MGLPNASIIIANGQLGSLLQLADGVAGYVLEGVSNGDITAGTPFLVTGLDDAVAQGLTNATNPFAYKVIKEHYDEAPIGSEVYIMLVADTMTVNLMADKTNANGAKKLLDFAEGKIALLSVMDNNDSPTVTNGLDANVATAKVNMQALAEEYATTYNTPFWGIIGGTGYNGTATDLTDQTASDQDYVSIMIGDTVSGTSAAVGLPMGRAAKEPVQRLISRVKSGALNIVNAYEGTTKVEKSTQVATIHDRGYITLRKFPSKNGYYFANDFTCTPSNNDFNRGARRRVINKMHRLAYLLLVEEIDDEVPTSATGTIDPPYAKYLEALVQSQLQAIMVANGELSDVVVSVDPNQNVVQSGKTSVVVKGLPVGYNNMIEATIGLTSSTA